MSDTRVFIGRLTHKAREEDIRRFFKGYGKIIDVSLKTGYGFVEFEFPYDAKDAVKALNNEEILGERVNVEHVKKLPHSNGRSSYGRSDYGRNRVSGFDDYRYGRSSRRYGPPKQTRYRVLVKNLSSRVTWRELKDYACETADVAFADAHKLRRNEGVLCFETYSGMKRAIRKMDDKMINGRRIQMVTDRSWSRSRSRSRRRSRSDDYSSRSRSRSYSRSRSRSRSGSRSRSRSRTRSRSVSKSRSRTRSRSHSRSVSRSMSRSVSRSPKVTRRKRSRSASARSAASKSRSPPRSVTPEKSKKKKKKKKSKSKHADKSDAEDVED